MTNHQRDVLFWTCQAPLFLLALITGVSTFTNNVFSAPPLVPLTLGAILIGVFGLLRCPPK